MGRYSGPDGTGSATAYRRCCWLRASGTKAVDSVLRDSPHESASLELSFVSVSASILCKAGAFHVPFGTTLVPDDRNARPGNPFDHSSFPRRSTHHLVL